jgi:hypothetical protein
VKLEIMLLEALFLFAEGEQTIKRCFRRSRTITYTGLKETMNASEGSKLCSCNSSEV